MRPVRSNGYETRNPSGPLAGTNVNNALVQVNKARSVAPRRPPSGQIVTFDPNVDSLRTTLTRGLTFKRLMPLIDAGDTGDITEALAIYHDMERADARVSAVANTRRLALTGLEWEVVGAAEVQRTVADKNLADEVAAYVREKLDAIAGFDRALEHLATAVGPNLAVLECVWGAVELVELVPVPHWRLMMDPTRSMDIRVRTAEDHLGIVAEAPKFVVHIPNAKPGSPIAVSLARAQALLWMIKGLALVDWSAFCEIFGMPIRWATYRPNSTPHEKRELLDMMESLSSHAYGVFSEGVRLEIKESTQRGT